MEDISIQKFEFKSSNNKNKIKVKSYNLEKNNLKAICIILHGMSESKEIYTEFAEYLAAKNFAVITYDNLGHGESIDVDDEKGFFSNENGYEYVTQDIKHVINEAKRFNLPIFLFGHSMGSLISRNYVSNAAKKEISGLILCGTIGPQWAIDGAIQFAEYMINKKGPRYRSRKLNELLIMVSNWKFEDMKYKLEWSTRDREYIEKVREDKSMNFIFTSAGFKDIFTLVKLTGQKENIEKIPKDLPILMISGGDDVLGEYSEGTKRLAEAYEKAGIKDVTVKFYEKARHNLIQEINRKEVFNDVYNWIESVRLAEAE